MSLPLGWADAPLTDIADVNPANPDAVPPDDTLVSFVPMALVEELTGRLDPSKHRPWCEVKKGFSKFQEGDVVVAKITPSMENGKAALARGLSHGVGADTTELHVLRPRPGLQPRYLLHFILQESFRRLARSRMTGTAGQLRVPTAFLEEQRVPLPPVAEQARIVESLDSMLSRLDSAVAILEAAQRKLKAYRASVLKAAVEGRLVPTEAELARRESRSYEPAAVLLECILKERRRRWEEAELAKVKAAGKTPKDDRWMSKYREPQPPKVDDLPSLPEGWCWTTLGIVAPLQAGFAFPSAGFANAGVRLLKGNNVRDGWIADDEDDIDHWPTADTPRFAHYLLRTGDVVLAMDRPVYSSGSRATKIARLGTSWEGALLLQRVGRFMRSDCVDGGFLYHFVSGEWFRRHIVLRQNGSQDGKDLPHVSAQTVDSCAFPLPPMLEQTRIADEAERVLSAWASVMKAVENELKRCSLLRQAILKWAFEGRLVDQDPADEPAEGLLARIRAEREVTLPAAQRTKHSRVAKAAS